MASEIMRAPEGNRALPSGMQKVAAGIAKAAVAQPRETIDDAIRSFNGIANYEKRPLQPLFDEGSVQPAGYADPPSKYLSQLHGNAGNLNDSGIVPMDQLLSNLKRGNLNFQQGVSSFLKSGIQEALAGLKIKFDPNVQRPVIPIPLNELISPEKLKNPDRTKLQSSVEVINEMFKTLKNVQNDVSDIRLKMLSTIRV